MTEFDKSIDPNRDTSQDKILIYRGTKKPHDRDRLGAWWSTDPYYGLIYSNGGRGGMFVALVDRADLDRLAKDVSIDEGYENFLFPEADPPDARPVTPEEIDALNTATTHGAPEDLDIPGGGQGLIKHPDNAIEIGRSIFMSKETGEIALSTTIEPGTETQK